MIDLYDSIVPPYRRLDPWQKLVLTNGLGMTSATEWAAWKVACWVARQNGKGGIIEALELAWLFLPGFQVPLITHSAHQYRTAREAFLRIKAIIEGSDDLRPQLARNGIREANGEQGIELANGQRLLFLARSRTGGRGFSAPRVVLDEAQELDGDMMASALPTMSAQPDPQVWFFGTPPDRNDAWCYNLKADGEANDGQGVDDLCWLDWGRQIDLDDPVDAQRVFDIDEAYAANPAMGAKELGGRITERFVRGEMKPSGLGDRYPYERLGVWRPRATTGAGVITDEQWRRQAVADPERPANVALALDINPARTHAAILAAGPRADGKGYQLLVIDYRPGTSWCVERLVGLISRWNPVAVAIDRAGPAGSLLLDLDKAGVKLPDDPDRPDRGQLIIPTAPQVAAAFGFFVDGVRDGTVWHADEGPLNAALAGAGIRSLSGGSAWERKGKADICPLVASNLALWAFMARAHLAEAAAYDLLSSVY